MRMFLWADLWVLALHRFARSVCLAASLSLSVGIPSYCHASDSLHCCSSLYNNAGLYCSTPLSAPALRCVRPVVTTAAEPFIVLGVVASVLLARCVRLLTPVEPSVLLGFKMAIYLVPL